MKKIYKKMSFFIAFALVLISNAGAQCTPDTTLSTAGFSPNPLPNGCVGQVYSQVVSFRFPNDTTINVPPFGNLTIPFDSFVVSAVVNIPAGLTYACNVGGACTYVTAPPAITRGCVTVSGTPTTPTNPGDSIIVVGVAWITLLGSPTSFSDSVHIGLTIDSLCLAGILGENGNAFGLSIFPNPVSGASVVKFTLDHTQQVHVNILDVVGRNVIDLGSSRRFAGDNEVTLNGAGNLPAGIYSVKVTLENSAFSATKKIIVVN